MVQVEGLGILSVNRLAEVLRTPREELVRLARLAPTYHKPFAMTKPARPFQRNLCSKTRPIDNPCGELKEIQRRINRSLLRPICFPTNILGAVPKRSILDNAELHLKAALLVTIDVKSCFPSVTNVHVYRVWRNFLGCSIDVATILTELTTFNRHLPQGAATSPLLANLFIWMIDDPIREACDVRSVTYSTWIDDLAFSGTYSRELIPVIAKVLQGQGLKISRTKVRIMGPREVKVLTGTRLGGTSIRASKERLSRVRSGIQKLELQLVRREDQVRFIDGLVGQLGYIERLNPKDSRSLVSSLAAIADPTVTSDKALRFLDRRRGK